MKQQLKIAAAIALLCQSSINAKTVQLKIEDIDGNPIPDNMSDDEQNPLIISLKEEPGHKIVINAHPLEHTALDMATPTILLSGEELISKRAGTLGEILRLEPGMNMSSFGPAVSRPIIRGLSGGRVKITNNQMIVQDASTISADHDVGLEPLLAEQIEVVKGPATLLYGSGAIGGVVNVMDRKINPNVEDGISGGIEIRLGDSSTGEQSSVFTLDGGSQSWNWHLDGYDSSTNDLQIPGFAESAILRHHEEEEGEEHAEEEEVFGVLENSATSTQGGSIGSTYITDKGYWGVSVNRIEKKYGVPGHAHHEEEHHKEDTVVIDMSQTRYDFQTKLNQPFKGIEQLFVGIAYTDYQHQELEGVELGTQFSNKATEFKSYIKHSEWQSWLGVFGVQLIDRDFSAIGDEAVVAPSKTKNTAVFWLEEKSLGALKWELGARFETQSIDTDLGDSRSNDGFSYSIGSVYSISKHNKLAFNLSHAVRFPNADEYFSNGAHLATQSFEIGNPNLNNESSNNLDFSYRFETDKIAGELNIFYNQFSDFIFAETVLLTDSCLTTDAITHAQQSELLLVCYKQQDATYTGLELQLEIPLVRVNGHELNLDLFTDLVRAELTDGAHLPRIPASKTGVVLNYSFQDFSADLTWVNYQTQNRTGQNELATKGFELLDLEFSYRMVFSESDFFVFLKGNNLLDEEARDHGSFIKDVAPRVGRNIVIGMRYTF